MNLEFFKYHNCGLETTGGLKVRLFRFKNSYNHKTIIEVIHYENNVYAFKFYLHSQKNSLERYSYNYPYNFLKNKSFYKTGATNFLLTMNTIIKIALDEILPNDPKASFGFLGAPKPTEKDKEKNAININNDGTIGDTTRFRIYSIYARRFFNPQTFEYVSSSSSSIMLLRNNKNKEVLTIEKAEKYIEERIIPSL